MNKQQQNKILREILRLAHNKRFNEFCAKIAPCFLTKEEWHKSNKKTAFILQVAKLYVQNKINTKWS